MSVTFAVDQEPVGFALTCGCGSVSGPMVTSFQDAHAGSASFVGCGDDFCGVYPPMAVAQYMVEAEVNVSNVNARYLLELLGVEAEELYGKMSGSEFLGRVLLAEALSVGDPGVPATQEGNFVECGRAEGYADARLASLREVAQAAADNSLNVFWS